MKHLKWLCLIFLVLTGCEDNLADDRDRYELKGRVDLRLGNPDSNNYHSITIDRSKTQTLHRFTGSLWFDIEGDSVPAEGVKVYWGSNTTWDFQGSDVPVINSASYSNASGIFNTMFAPTKAMVGDTIEIYAGWYDLDGNDVVKVFGIICR
tara:strand:- start:2362 stop:2814 length:453 start_codon:yes stop_codon:yes gene_type:complete